MSVAAELEKTLAELSDEAFNVFADDISTMFDVGAGGKQVHLGSSNFADLKKKYRQKCGMWSVDAKGFVNGYFYLLVKIEGLFTLAGTFVMQPEQIILQNRTRGDSSALKDLSDAIGEVGNLMVGSWDRAFREGSEQHDHFKQTETILNDPWQALKTKGVNDKDQAVVITYEMKVEPFEPFECAVIYPQNCFELKQQSVIQQEPQNSPQQSVNLEPAAVKEVGVEKQEVVAQIQTTPELPQEIQPVVEERNEEKPVTKAIKELIKSDIPAVSSDIKAENLLKTDIIWANREDTVEKVLNLMQQKAAECVLVGDGKSIEGIVCDSDIQAALSPYLRPVFSKWKRPLDTATLQIKIKWIMSRPVHTVRPEASIKEIAAKMRENRIKCLPVVDDGSNVKGLITVYDVISVF